MTQTDLICTCDYTHMCISECQQNLFNFKDLDAEMTGMIEKKLTNRMVSDLVRRLQFYRELSRGTN